MDKQKLIQTAADGLGRSYVSHPHFHVSAALLCADGTVYTGNNIENMAYMSSVCVERCAISKAMGGGRRESEVIAVCGGLDGAIEDYCPPYGVYKQVTWEFCDPSSSRVLVAKIVEDYREYTLGQPLPDGSGPDHLTRSEGRRKVVDGCGDV